MSFWTVFFEITVLVYFTIAVILLVKEKSYRSLSTMITGAIFGVVLEFVNVFVTQTYVYSENFIIQVGSSPNNIPLVIGLSWGLLLETSHQISECFDFPIFIRTLFESVFVVTLDLFLDVVAVRLEGGFWIWKNTPLVSTITTSSLFGIPWGNFYGWFCVIFFSSLILHVFDKINDSKKNDDEAPDNWKILLMRIIFTVIIAESLLWGFLNLLRLAVSFIWLFFVILYFGSLVILSIYIIKNKSRAKSKLPNVFPLAYYLFSYLFCIVTMVVLGLASEITIYMNLYVFLGILVNVNIGFMTQFRKAD